LEARGKGLFHQQGVALLAGLDHVVHQLHVVRVLLQHGPQGTGLLGQGKQGLVEDVARLERLDAVGQAQGVEHGIDGTKRIQFPLEKRFEHTNLRMLLCLFPPGKATGNAGQDRSFFSPARPRGFCGFTRPAAAGIRESPLTISPYLDMQIFTNPQDLAAQCRSWHAAGEDIALVPTMGYYHAGHEALMDQGRGLAKRLVVSLFVNPTQFGPNEDLSAYPRDIERDTQIAAAHGADAIFIPEPASMYAEDHATWVEVPDLSRIMCGLSRPTHFRGVCTVVLKLFMITQADVAVFGQKDWQQQAILRRMVRDLNVPVRIETCPIVREEDGLALSSRNVYLTEEERRQAPWIHRGLQLARDMAQKGQTHAKILREAALCTWADHLTLGRLDYLSVVDPVSMEPLDTVEGPALMACAIRMGKARLIDNILLRD